MMVVSFAPADIFFACDDAHKHDLMLQLDGPEAALAYDPGWCESKRQEDGWAVKEDEGERGR